MKKATPAAKSTSKSAAPKGKSSTSAAKLKDLPADKSPRGGAKRISEKEEK